MTILITGNYGSNDIFGVGALQDPKKTNIVVQGSGCYITSASNPKLVYYVTVTEKFNFQSVGCKYLLSFVGDASLTTLMANASLRSQLVTNLTKVINDNGFDGFQSDWEDFGNGVPQTLYHQFLVAARAAMPNKIIMPAIPADPAYGWLNTTDMPYIDYLVLMIYGGAGADKIGTSLSYFTSSITKFLNAGYPAAKLLAGIPVYTDDSADWFGAYYQTIQQFQPATSLNQLSKTTANGLNGDTVVSKTVQGGILYFNGADLMVSKTQWAIDHSLGGIYLWIINWDAAPGSPNSLLDATYNTIYKTSIEHPWDVNKDNKVDIIDLTLVGQHFGETY
jgi:spore germination protein YaaH